MTALPSRLSRRSLLAGGVALLAASAGVHAQRAPVAIEVWKDAGSGCCGDWIAHLEANGFKVTAHDGGNEAVRQKLGIAQRHASCHTAVVGGYGIEGHVPAREIHRLLREKPQAIGLAVPGMPVGSPGMDGPAYGGRRDAYAVLLLGRDGSARAYQRYDGNKA